MAGVAGEAAGLVHCAHCAHCVTGVAANEWPAWKGAVHQVAATPPDAGPLLASFCSPARR